MNDIQIKDWIEIAAIFLGPVVAVVITRMLDARNEKYKIRKETFKTLMATRSNQINPAHVNALNAIEIVFQGKRDVLGAWKGYFNNLQFDETGKTEAERFRHYNQRSKLFAKLVSEIAKVLNFKIEQLEIMDGGYTPQAWLDIENEQALMRKYMLTLLKGQICLPVHLQQSPTIAEIFEGQKKTPTEDTQKGAANDSAKEERVVSIKGDSGKGVVV